MAAFFSRAKTAVEDLDRFFHVVFSFFGGSSLQIQGLGYVDVDELNHFF